MELANLKQWQAQLGRPRTRAKVLWLLLCPLLGLVLGWLLASAGSSYSVEHEQTLVVRLFGVTLAVEPLNPGDRSYVDNYHRPDVRQGELWEFRLAGLFALAGGLTGLMIGIAAWLRLRLGEWSEQLIQMRLRSAETVQATVPRTEA
jgi:hypothetical protein